MKKVTIIDETGKRYDAFTPENNNDLKGQIADDRKQTFKEHLYMGYLMIGTIAFTLGILISLKRLQSK